MRRVLTVRVVSFAFLYAVAVFTPAASAQSAGQIESMKLLTDNTGWAATSKKLFWTADNGANWKDITPKFSYEYESIACVFFLNTSTGWVLLAHGGGNDGAAFELASTGDAGKDWTMHVLGISGIAGRSAAPDGPGYMEFLDAMHGSIDLHVSSSANFNLGILLVTSDGGMSWDRTPDNPGYFGTVRFVTANDGWLAGGPGGEKLFVTHDGARSWAESHLDPPKELGKAVYPVYGLPVFNDAQDGYLPVSYSGPEDSQPGMVLYHTTDGGRKWETASLLLGLDRVPSGLPVPTAVVGHELIVAFSRGKGTFVLARSGHAGRGGAVAASFDAPNAGFAPVSFISEMHGWAIVGGRVVSTSDSGASWIAISPGKEARAANEEMRGPAGQHPRPTVAVPTGPTHVSNRLGIHQCQAPPSAPLT